MDQQIEYGEEEYSDIEDGVRDIEEPIYEEEEETSQLNDEPNANQILSADIRKTLTNQQHSIKESIQLGSDIIQAYQPSGDQSKSLQA